MCKRGIGWAERAYECEGLGRFYWYSSLKLCLTVYRGVAFAWVRMLK